MANFSGLAKRPGGHPFQQPDGANRYDQRMQGQVEEIRAQEAKAPCDLCCKKCGRDEEMPPPERPEYTHQDRYSGNVGAVAQPIGVNGKHSDGGRYKQGGRYQHEGNF